MYGVAVAAIGMLSTLVVGLTIDAYGPVADNAGGIAEMTGMGESIRDRTDVLDSAGNTTAAIGKGFAIGSAILTSLALFSAFLTRANLLDPEANIMDSINLLDPACGSGGMFVQSANFVREHRKNPSNELSIFGAESKDANLKTGKMNLAVQGLSGDLSQGNTYYEDPHNSLGKFDFVMANPPFNVDGVDKERIKDEIVDKT